MADLGSAANGRRRKEIYARGWVVVKRLEAKTAGIPYHHIPFSASAPDPAAVDTFLKTTGTPGVQPVFIH